jgi:pre-mRNA-processing factor 39
LVKSLEQEVTHCGAEISTENIHMSEVMEAEEFEGDISTKIAGLFDQGGHLKPEALKQYLFAGDRLYRISSKLNEEICGFEASIRRPFFHVKPLDDDQLENWNQYLDFVEKNGDFDWVFFFLLVFVFMPRRLSCIVLTADYISHLRLQFAGCKTV